MHERAANLLKQKCFTENFDSVETFRYKTRVNVNVRTIFIRK